MDRTQGEEDHPYSTDPLKHMALLLEKTLYNGVVTRYHKISGYTLDPELGMATAQLESYTDLNHRAIPTISLASEAVSFSWSGDTATLASEAYEHIKTLPGWSGALDV